MIVIPSGEGKHAAVLRLTSCRAFMPARASAIPGGCSVSAAASAIPAACNASAARRHVATALLPATVTPGHSNTEAQGAISPIRYLSSGPVYGAAMRAERN